MKVIYNICQLIDCAPFLVVATALGYDLVKKAFTKKQTIIWERKH